MLIKSSATLRNDYGKREQLMKLRSKIAIAENSRRNGERTVLLSDAKQMIEEKYNAKV